MIAVPKGGSGQAPPARPPAAAGALPPATSELPEGSVFARPLPGGGYEVKPPIIAAPNGAGQTPAVSAPPVERPAAAPPVERAPKVRPASAVRAAIVPGAIMAGTLLIGVGVGWYLNDLFKEDWEEEMQRVETWLSMFLAVRRLSFKPGTALFAVVDIDIETGSMNMAEAGWAPVRAGVRLRGIQVTDHAVAARQTVEEEPWWHGLFGSMGKTTRITFSFPLPAAEGQP